MAGWQRCMRSVLSKVSQNCLNCTYSTQFQGGQLACLRRVSDLSSKRIPGHLYQYLQYSGFFSSWSLSAEDVSNMEPISSPLIPLLGDRKPKAKDGTSKPLTVQAFKKGIKQVFIAVVNCKPLLSCHTLVPFINIDFNAKKLEFEKQLPLTIDLWKSSKPFFTREDNR